MQVKTILIVFIVGSIMFFLGYSSGKKDGVRQGMSDFVELIKVYDKSLLKQVGALTKSILNMTDSEKIAKLNDYLNH